MPDDLLSHGWNESSVGFRLPTESEWEYAARAGTRHVYAGGDDLGAVGWFADNSGGRTQPVGQKLANRYGLHDMSGNVWEWCWDLYGDYPSGSVATDPTGPSSGPSRVRRGGSWNRTAGYARVARRGGYTAGFGYGYLGLRLSRALPSDWQSWESVPALAAAVMAARPAAPPAAPAPPPPAVREAGARRVVSGAGKSAFRFEVATIPPGEFEMGSPPSEEGRDAYETQHRVRLTRGFELGIVPVTQALYAAVMGANPSERRGDALPVENVSWFDAVRFCNAVSRACGLPEAYTIGGGDEPSVRWDASSGGFRLPTESEWEYAARAGTRHVYAGGDDLGAVGWFKDNSGGRTQPVGQKLANRYGLHDMSGNVWEWCWDIFGGYPSGSVATDPTGPSSGPNRVFRGGSWNYAADYARVAGRFGNPAGRRFGALGLRLSRTLP